MLVTTLPLSTCPAPVTLLALTPKGHNLLVGTGSAYTHVLSLRLVTNSMHAFSDSASALQTTSFPSPTEHHKSVILPTLHQAHSQKLDQGWEVIITVLQPWRPAPSWGHHSFPSETPPEVPQPPSGQHQSKMAQGSSQTDSTPGQPSSEEEKRLEKVGNQSPGGPNSWDQGGQKCAEFSLQCTK